MGKYRYNMSTRMHIYTRAQSLYIRLSMSKLTLHLNISTHRGNIFAQYTHTRTFADIHYIRVRISQPTQYLQICTQPHALRMHLNVSNISYHTQYVLMNTTAKASTLTYNTNYVQTVYKLKKSLST